ncbi:hypothetical protein Lalb_Chr22g0353091 [Lupinus albus]|uniref:Uncharacterized protein n=1 Tax=Lupinus albus TaxID=3870 RepID=A0A6A4NHC1_LUPAL|nr:hypothetical protein Lalb_Chr22g0353091 [Lupinus albus]
MKPRTRPDLTPKLHFVGFSLRLYFRRRSNSLLRFPTCSPSDLDLHMMSST